MVRHLWTKQTEGTGKARQHRVFGSYKVNTLMKDFKVCSNFASLVVTFEIEWNTNWRKCTTPVPQDTKSISDPQRVSESFAFSIHERSINVVHLPFF